MKSQTVTINLNSANSMINCIKSRYLQLLILIGFSLIPLAVWAAPAYSPPPGGWTYMYEATNHIAAPAAAFPLGFVSLDGTWNHNSSSSWDGSAPGGALLNSATFGAGNAPGGLGTFTESGTNFLRIQDPGDPGSNSGPSYKDPFNVDYAPNFNNRRLLFVHNLTNDTAGDLTGVTNIMDAGVTLTFRARIPTAAKSTSPVDMLFPAGLGPSGTNVNVPDRAYPTAGDGAVPNNNGKGMFLINQMMTDDVATHTTIGFSLTVSNDLLSSQPVFYAAPPATGAAANFAGLTMNTFNGSLYPSGLTPDAGNSRNTLDGPYGTVGPDFGRGIFRGIPFDSTDWHEFWIVLKKDPYNIGTHRAFIFMDGASVGTEFAMSMGTGSESAYSAISYIGMGCSGDTASSSAVDVDFFGYKVGAYFPTNALTNAFIGGIVGSPVGFKLGVDDGTTTTNDVDAATVSVKLNGSSITAGVSKSGNNTTITYLVPSPTNSPLASLSSNFVEVTFGNTSVPPATNTLTASFIVPFYATLPASIKLASDADTNAPGFTTRVVQYPFNGLQGFLPLLANREIVQTLVDPFFATPFANQATPNVDGTFLYDEPGVLNYREPTAGGDGFFTTPADIFPPGIPGTGAVEPGNYYNEEFITYIPLTAGLHRFGIYTDDGHGLSAGGDPRDVPNLIKIGGAEGGKAGERRYYFYVAEAGTYPFRVLSYDGNSTSSLEFFSIDPVDALDAPNYPAITRTLINDPAGLLSYSKTVTQPVMTSTRSGGNVILSWTGFGWLESAPTVTGPWADIAGASPKTVTPTAGQMFYRIRR